MKTIRFLIFSLFIVAITSCAKNENDSLDFDTPDTIVNEAINSKSYPSIWGAAADTIQLKIKRATRESAMGKFGSNAMVVQNGLIWSVGGIHPENEYSRNNEVWSSNDGMNWSLRTIGPFPKQRGHTLTIFNNQMWLIGKGIWKSSNGITWKHIVKNPPFGHISLHNTLVFNNKLFVIRGSSVWSSDNGIDWQVETYRAFPPINFHSAVVFNNAMYVIGGYLGQTFIPSNTIWRSTDGANWTRLRTRGEGFRARYKHTSTVYNDKVFIVGGTIEGFNWSNEIWYSTDMLTWLPYEEKIPFAPLSSHQSLVFNNMLWNFGGWKDPTGITGEIWKIIEVN